MSPLLAPLRPFVSLVAAVAMTAAGIGASATPARADDELARLLAGAAGIVILYALLDQGRRDRSVASPPGPGCKGSHCRPPNVHPVHPALPAHCALQITDRQHGRNVYYGRRCLRQAGVPIWTLPQRCEAQLRARNVTRVLYRADCLARAGFRTHPGRFPDAPHTGRNW